MSPSPLEKVSAQGIAYQYTEAAAQHTDALTDRVNAWLGVAMTRAKVRPVTDTDLFTATLPPFRKVFGSGLNEGLTLADLREKLHEWAKGELIAGRELLTWESKIPEVSPEAKRLVRLSNLKHELRTRGKQWGGERQLLPAGAVERCLADIDAVVTRHAMQIQGVPLSQKSTPTPEPQP